MAIPVILITGFLGSGKTTLLNHLLSLSPWVGRHVALVINEFGTLGVDGKLLRGDARAKYEINKGSLFCTCTRDEFLGVLHEIADDGQTEHVFVEASGVAETADIETYLAQPPLAGAFRLQANLCVVDGAGFVKVAPFLQAATTQVAAADAIVINKTDLVSGHELNVLRRILGDINPAATVTETSRGVVTADFVERLRHRPCGRRGATQPPRDLVAVAVTTDRCLDRVRFEATLAELGPALLRLKGNIDFGDGPRLVEWAGQSLSEAEPVEGFERHTSFTAIGYRIGREQLAHRFRQSFA